MVFDLLPVSEKPQVRNRSTGEQPHVQIGQAHEYQARPRPQHVIAVEDRQSPPGPVARFGKPYARVAIRFGSGHYTVMATPSGFAPAKWRLKTIN